MFITSVISLTLFRRLSNINWWTLAKFSSVVAVFGRPKRSSSPKLLRPRLNSAAQNVSVVNDGAESSTHSNDCYITTARPKWLKLWWVTFNRWTTKFTSFYLRVLLSSCWGLKLFRPPRRICGANSIDLIHSSKICREFSKNWKRYIQQSKTKTWRY